MLRQSSLLIVIALLAGCGQKGNLYLPESRDVVPPSSTGATASPAQPAAEDADAEARRRQQAAPPPAGN